MPPTRWTPKTDPMKAGFSIESSANPAAQAFPQKSSVSSVPAPTPERKEDTRKNAKRAERPRAWRQAVTETKTATVPAKNGYPEPSAEPGRNRPSQHLGIVGKRNAVIGKADAGHNRQGEENPKHGVFPQRRENPTTRIMQLLEPHPGRLHEKPHDGKPRQP